MPGTIHNGDSLSPTTVTLFDTDPGIDDAFALALALASPEVNLRYVTTVAGNTESPVSRIFCVVAPQWT